MATIATRLAERQVDSFLAGGGELGALMRAKNWSATPLGAPAGWSPSVKTAVNLCLNARFPILLWLGPELRLVYNDAHIPFLGETKHPDMLGAPGREAWAEIWAAIGPMHEEVRAGRSTWVEDFQLFFARRLPLEEVYVTFSYSPILAEDGRTVEGTFNVCTETTERVVGERRLLTLRGLGLRADHQHTVEAACQHAAAVLDGIPLDIPFAAIYLLDEDGRTARLVAGARLPEDHPAFAVTQSLAWLRTHHRWPFAEAARSQQAIDVANLPRSIGTFKAPLWPDVIEDAMVLPLAAPGQQGPSGFLVVGISPRRVLDVGYRSFLGLVAEHIAASVAEARAFQDERRRAEVLTEIDRAKTAFFSNVSHEFRTPLTLMMSPLEELLAKPETELGASGRELAEVAQRNSARLLKLVNTLLDFSRFEAGRIEAVYEPTDLSGLTVELASSFRSACERAGLRLDVLCGHLPQPVYVDRDMWEKIVLNLLSNAFKFTLEGGIAVRIAAKAGAVELRVSDSGSGISERDQPRLFERFYRVEGQRGRSFEGSGIGLALVQELVHLHGGSIAVESKVGKGTTFSVTLPFGSAHLPADQISGPRVHSPAATRATVYVAEIPRWPTDHSSAEEAPPCQAAAPGEDAPAQRGRILLADDNADMRGYLTRLLAGQWEVEAVADGVAALAAARRRRPDLVLSDVMMPHLDGFGLIAALRQDADLAEVPTILLSARAGAEAHVEGLGAGADDYLIKPFAARELLARVAAHIALSRLRREAGDRVRKSAAQLQAAVDLVSLSPYAWDRATGTLECDAKFRAIWGLPADAHVDIGVFLAGIHPKDRQQVETAIAACVDPAGDGVYTLEHRVIGIGDGVERWVATHGQAFFEAGRPMRFIGAIREITGRKRAEERLRESEERFRQFARHSTNVIWIVDAVTSRVDYLSPAYERIWGEPVGAMLGQDWNRWTAFFHADDRERATRKMERVLGGEEGNEEYRIVRPDGSVRWIRDAFFPIRDEQGQVARIAGIAEDITVHEGALVYVIAGDDASRQSLSLVLQGAGYEAKAFPSLQAFVEVAPALASGCVLLDVRASETGGLAIPRELKARQSSLPVIVVGDSLRDPGLGVRAMKAGAVDYLEMPCEREPLLAAVATALADIREETERHVASEIAQARIAGLPPREREVLQGLLAGGTNKMIARDLGISPRTVEFHRAQLMERLGARTLPEAVLVAAAAGMRPPQPAERRHDDSETDEN